MKVNPDAQAVLIWLPSGEKATAASFNSNQGQPLTLREAVNHAIALVPDHAKIPWIKVDGDILGPDQITWVASGLRAMGRFEA
jgi:hypothetical protein